VPAAYKSQQRIAVARGSSAALGENMNNLSPTIARCLLTALLASPAMVEAADPFLAGNAPKDCNAKTTSEDLASIVERFSSDALKTWPTAKQRFLAGLPAQHSLFVTLLLSEPDGTSEYLFVAVDEIVEDQIRGRVWNDVKNIRGLYFRAPIQIPEDAISDWLISKPDGSEDGNIVGKYMDTLEQCRKREVQQ
jgi:hypothetical protein